jgi:hypothetical protein
VRLIYLVVAAAIVTTLLEGVPPASADAGKPTDHICEVARSKAGKPGPCAIGRGGSIGKPVRPSARDLDRLGALRAAGSGVTLREAAATTPVYCRTWSQWERGLYYVNWMEKHTGRFCYNGRDVWVDGDHGGYHRCDQGYGILYDIQVKDCATNKIFVDTAAGYGYQNWDYYRVHVVWKGIPLYQSHDMHTNVYPSGNLYFKY